ncbi:MAG: ABC transporter transmembrane domain-containing protein [marine benthic group bacterium]|jgi:subfamily B ATP-binding cassette protein MsbA|nr:ABC transporter transmembrane domain-containing protein [Gemmatimonadota bacterium]MCL7982133.1 ABC transporter transmembrane domain-containing protein [Gemmatimonadota bacterium]MCL7983797.1 ABC transporter transmembrane domain-containing protein [Gemmatimonadota bacterium]
MIDSSSTLARPVSPLRRLIPRLQPHRYALAAAAVALVASAAIGLAFPLVVRYLMDAAFEVRDPEMLNRVAIFLIGLFGIQAVLNFVQVFLLGATAERVVAGLRTDLYSHLLTLSPGFFTNRNSGELTARLASDCSTLGTVLSHQVAEFFRQVLFLFGGLALLAVLHSRLMLTTVTVAPIVVLSAYAFGQILRKQSTKVQDRLAQANAAAEEALTQIPVVQSFVREGWEEQRYGSRIQSALREAVGRSLVRGVFFGLVTFIAFGGVAVVLWEGGRLVIAQEITAGELVSFLLYAVTVAAAITALASLWSGYQEAMGAAQRVFDLMDTEPEIMEPRHSEALPPASDPGGLAFHDVWFRYGQEEPWILRGLSVELKPGEAVALVGPSGAGKTTIASLVPRFWDPTQGHITLRGTDLRRIPLIELRTAVGIVPQDPLLFADTVAANIAYGKPEATAEEIERAARLAHAHEFIERLAEGYDSQVGERGSRLSGGQRQRIAIARIFLKEPEILILDEATSSLDTESEQLVEQALESAMRGRTTLIIAHRLRTVQRADRVLVVDGGEILEQGRHAELASADGLYARLYRGQLLDPEPEFVEEAAVRPFEDVTAG